MLRPPGREPIAPSGDRWVRWVSGLPGLGQFRQGRRAAGWFFSAWAGGVVALGAVIAWEEMPFAFWTLWGLAFLLLCQASVLDVARYARMREARRRQELCALLFPGRPPRSSGTGEVAPARVEREPVLAVRPRD